MISYTDSEGHAARTAVTRAIPETARNDHPLL
jgi:hypothetical protein